MSNVFLNNDGIIHSSSIGKKASLSGSKDCAKMGLIHNDFGDEFVGKVTEANRAEIFD